jgi:hypothetical protein
MLPTVEYYEELHHRRQSAHPKPQPAVFVKLSLSRSGSIQPSWLGMDQEQGRPTTAVAHGALPPPSSAQPPLEN